jgi:hypothetical protein
MRLDKLTELLIELSPEVSRALFDYLTMCNPGWELKAFRPGTETEDETANSILKEFIATLGKNHGSPDVVFNRLFIYGFSRGAFTGECVLDEAARDFVDIATPDPYFLAYRKEKDPVRRVIWTVGQIQRGEYVRLDDLETFVHIPIHPMSAKPKGLPLASSAFFIALFLMGLLHDLKRVIQQQGYPRIDIEVIFEKLKSQMPKDATNNPGKLKQWAADVVAAVKSVYSQLKPDDTYIHSDAIKVNSPVGALNPSSLGIIDALFKALERMLTRALKTMPLLMATTDGVSEANANRQWEIYAQGIKSLQHYVESLLERLFKVALRARGKICDVQFRFAELRAAELLRDAQVELLQVTIARALYDNGVINMDEMAQRCGKQTADAKEPRDAQASTSGNPGGNPEPGSMRGALSVLRQIAYGIIHNATNARQAPTGAQVDKVVDFWKHFAPEVISDATTAGAA